MGNHYGVEYYGTRRRNSPPHFWKIIYGILVLVIWMLVACDAVFTASGSLRVVLAAILFGLPIYAVAYGCYWLSSRNH